MKTTKRKSTKLNTTKWMDDLARNRDRRMLGSTWALQDAFSFLVMLQNAMVRMRRGKAADRKYLAENIQVLITMSLNLTRVAASECRKEVAR